MTKLGNLYVVRIEGKPDPPFTVGPFTHAEARQFAEIASTTVAAGYTVEILHLTPPEEMAQLANSMNVSELAALRQRAH